MELSPTVASGAGLRPAPGPCSIPQPAPTDASARMLAREPCGVMRQHCTRRQTPSPRLRGSGQLPLAHRGNPTPARGLVRSREAPDVGQPPRCGAQPRTCSTPVGRACMGAHPPGRDSRGVLRRLLPSRVHHGVGLSPQTHLENPTVRRRPRWQWCQRGFFVTAPRPSALGAPNEVDRLPPPPASVYLGVEQLECDGLSTGVMSTELRPSSSTWLL